MLKNGSCLKATEFQGDFVSSLGNPPNYPCCCRKADPVTFVGLFTRIPSCHVAIASRDLISQGSPNRSRDTLSVRSKPSLEVRAALRILDNQLKIKGRTSLLTGLSPPTGLALETRVQ